MSRLTCLKTSVNRSTEWAQNMPWTYLFPRATGCKTNLMSLKDYSWSWLFQGSTYLVPSSPLRALECDVTRQRCALFFLAQAPNGLLDERIEAC